MLFCSNDIIVFHRTGSNCVRLFAIAAREKRVAVQASAGATGILIGRQNGLSEKPRGKKVFPRVPSVV